METVKSFCRTGFERAMCGGWTPSSWGQTTRWCKHVVNALSSYADHICCSNPVDLGKWLERACIDMDVRIQTSTKVTAVELDQGNRATAVTVLRDDSSSVRIPCDNFVLAGAHGPHRFTKRCSPRPQSRSTQPQRQAIGSSSEIRSLLRRTRWLLWA